MQIFSLCDFLFLCSCSTVNFARLVKDLLQIIIKEKNSEIGEWKRKKTNYSLMMVASLTLRIQLLIAESLSLSLNCLSAMHSGGKRAAMVSL